MTYTMWVLFLPIFYVQVAALKVTFPYYLKESIERSNIDRIGNMTREIVMDVKGKNRNLQIINDKYKEAQDFQLGILSAVVQSSFKDLLIVYSDYCRLEVFENNTYETSEYLVAYHFMQGQFNDLKFQKNIYFDVKEGFTKRKKFLDILGKQLHTRYGTDRGRLGQLQRLPEEVVNDKKNLARELIIRDIAPRRADLLEVESLVDRAVNIEKITRRSNSHTTDNGQKYDVVDSMWNKLLKNFERI